MQKYSEFKPTGFDAAGLGAERLEIGEWLVLPTSRTRDSRCLDESNFHSALRALGGESDDVQVHRFGHWACGWFEIIIVKPDTDAAREAQEIADALEDYPVVDESDWSERESDAVYQMWSEASLRDRIADCARFEVSIFAARRTDEIPERIEQHYSSEV